MFQLLHVAAQTAPHDAALLCTSIPAVATAQSPTKPPFWKSLLALVSGSMLNQDTLLLFLPVRLKMQSNNLLNESVVLRPRTRLMLDALHRGVEACTTA